MHIQMIMIRVINKEQDDQSQNFLSRIQGAYSGICGFSVLVPLLSQLEFNLLTERSFQ